MMSVTTLHAGCLLCVSAVAVLGCGRAPLDASTSDTRTHAISDAQPVAAAEGDLAGPPVKIGWFGPDDPGHPIGGDMWRAATLAIEHANANGGIERRPIQLMTAWSQDPWGSGVKDVTRLVYDQKVWALAGAPDGAAVHLVEQVVAKARLVFVSCVSTDTTANLANVPWIFSCAPSDDAQARVLSRAIADSSQRLVVISCSDHDSRQFASRLMAALNRAGRFPAHHLTFSPGRHDFASILQTVKQSSPDSVVIVAGPDDSARMLKSLKESDSSVRVFGGPAMGHRQFIHAAGETAEDVRFPLIWHPIGHGPEARAFAGEFQQRFGHAPDYTAAYTYDGLGILVEAMREAGFDRERIRDAVRAQSGWGGVTGALTWDDTGQNIGTVRIGTIDDGNAVPVESIPASMSQP